MFYGQPELESIIWVNAAIQIVSSASIIQNVMLQRQYLFRAGFIAEMGATVFAGFLALILGFLHYGVWALVTFSLGQQIAKTFLLWKIVRWKPRGRFCYHSLCSLWTFSAHLLFASLYHNVATNLTTVLIGKYYPATVLGLFTRAQSMQSMPVVLFIQPFQRVSFPLYSRHQHDVKALRELMRKHLRVLSVMSAYVTAMLLTCGTEVVPLIFGDRWTESGNMLEILAPAIFPAMLAPLHSEANKSLGNGRWFLWIEIVKKTLLVFVVALASFFGIKGLLLALVFVAFSDYYLSAISSVRFIEYSWKEQMSDMLPALFICLVAALVALLTDTVISPSGGKFVTLLLKGSVVSIVFGVIFLMFGSRLFPEAFFWVNSSIRRTATWLSS